MINKNLNNIEIPKNIDEFIDKGIERIIKEQKETRNKRKKIISGLAAGLTIAITLFITNPAFAEDVPVLREIFKFFEINKEDNPMLHKNNLSQHTTELGITTEDKGIKITTEEVVYDGEYVYISYKVESERVFPYKTKTYLVNDNGVEKYETKDIDFMWLEQKAIINDSKQELYSSNHLGGMIVDDNTFIGIVKYQVPNLDDGTKPESFEVNINIDYVCFPREKDDKDNMIFYEDNKFKVDGNWSFNIPVALDKSLEKVIEVNEVKEGFKLESIIINQFYIKAKIIPLKEENQKVNTSDGGGKELQQHHAKIIDLNGSVYNRSANSYVNDPDEVVGTMYVTFERGLNDDFDSLKVEVEDYTILNQSCTKDCENPEIHENSLHPKKFEFDTKIEID